VKKSKKRLEKKPVNPLRVAELKQKPPPPPPIDYREARRFQAEAQLQADLRQLVTELTKLMAMATAIMQQMQETAERYRKTQE